MSVFDGVPKTSGWYWVEHKQDGSPTWLWRFEILVERFEFHNPNLTGWLSSVNYRNQIPVFKDCEWRWSGPIPNPFEVIE